MHSVSFSAQLQLRAEPRLSLAWVGEPRLIEAADDRGRSLRPVAAAAAKPADRPVYVSGALPQAGPVDLPLALPEGPVAAIRRLRGTLPDGPTMDPARWCSHHPRAAG